jgi:hypothetical protein
MSRVLLAALAFLILSTTLARAEEKRPEPTRFIVIRAWRGDTLVTMSMVPIVPGFPATISSGSTREVPEGMAPPPLKVNMLISIRLVGDTPQTPSMDAEQTEAALAGANHYVIEDVELRIIERDADRFVAVLFDKNAFAAQAVTLPPEAAFAMDDADFLPQATITGWISGGLKPPESRIIIERNPVPSSITLPENEE